VSVSQSATQASSRRALALRIGIWRDGLTGLRMRRARCNCDYFLAVVDGTWQAHARWDSLVCEAVHLSALVAHRSGYDEGSPRYAQPARTSRRCPSSSASTLAPSTVCNITSLRCTNPRAHARMHTHAHTRARAIDRSNARSKNAGVSQNSVGGLLARCWRLYVAPFFYKLVAVLAALLSALLVWSELTIAVPYVITRVCACQHTDAGVVAASTLNGGESAGVSDVLTQSGSAAFAGGKLVCYGATAMRL
jgi:hypothetical protein